jgi:hypothetical protein
MVQVFRECLRVCRGLVAMVVEGFTKNYRWSATPALLMADLHRAGICLRKPPVFHRIGIAGSGGPDWLRNDWEFVICAAHPGRLPWSDNTAMGHKPKWAPGGEMSHRLTDGSRRNQWEGSNEGVTDSETHTRTPQGKRTKRGRPSHRLGRGMCNGPGSPKGSVMGRRVPRGHKFNGELLTEDAYFPPAIANPGNVIKCDVGGGVMGDRICHESEAPFPEKLVEFFIRSFCPPAGTVLDCFSGSGTTSAVAERLGRNGVGLDIRDSQCLLGLRRLRKGIDRELFVS